MKVSKAKEGKMGWSVEVIRKDESRGREGGSDDCDDVGVLMVCDVG
jgi:hypothetical protein